MNLEKQIFIAIFKAIDCGAEGGNAHLAWKTIYPHSHIELVEHWVVHFLSLEEHHRGINASIDKIIRDNCALALLSSIKVIRERAEYCVRTRA